jgi:hypothetical protein
MKITSRLLTATFFAATVLFSACTKEKAATAVPADNLAAHFTTGNWEVSSLIQRTEDKTSQFNGIVFTFSADNKVKAAEKNGSVTNGSWVYTPSVTYYGATSKEAISINMGTGSPFNRITKTWNVVSSTTTVAKFDNPQLVEDEHLQFMKQ